MCFRAGSSYKCKAITWSLWEEFNASYEGSCVVEVEWLTESTQATRERLKQVNVLDDMWAVITDAGF